MDIFRDVLLFVFLPLTFAGMIWLSMFVKAHGDLLAVLRATVVHLTGASDSAFDAINKLEEFWQSRGPCKACGKHRYQADFPTSDKCGLHDRKQRDLNL